MRNARIAIVIIGILLPYAARLPGGSAWLAQYTDIGLAGWLVFGAFNAIAWGALVGLSFCFRRPVALIAPSGLGFGYLAWMHARLDLASDAQAGVGLAFIPIYALLPIAIGAAIGAAIEWWFRHRRA